MDFAALAAYNPNKAEPRPSVSFEVRAVEDRSITATDGVTHMKDVDWALVRAPGSRDVMEKLAVDWLAQLDTYAKDGRIPPDWPGQYRAAFQAWKAGNELPVHGTPIKTWTVPSPAQRTNILNAGITTIEDLAAANDEIRGRIGMGALTLVQAAKNWLEEGKTAGAMAQALADANVKLESQASTIAELTKAVNELKVKSKLTT